MLRVTVDVNGDEKIRLAAVRIASRDGTTWYAVEGAIGERTRKVQVGVEDGAGLGEVAASALRKLVSGE